ncbi:MAG TPA: type II secretion system F family protein [Chloroflexota bacterium]|jgi:tight adherence protein C
MTPQVAVVAPIATFISVSLLVASLLRPKKNEARDKLKAYAYRAAQDRDNLARPFSERLIFPFLDRLGRLFGSTAPKRVRERMEQTLGQAGNPISIHGLVAIRGLGMLVAPPAYLLLVLSIRHAVVPANLAVTAFLFVLGAYLPKRWLSAKAAKRQRAIERALPDALDLIVVSMEAGLALDGAIAKVVEKTRGPLRQEFQRALQEIRLGKPRREALRELGHRTGVRDLQSLVSSIIQADQMGVSMAQVMRTQADEARLKRRQRAEERAHQAAVKMLFPLVLFILPSVMIVTIGPAALTIYRQFSSGFLG